MQGKGLRRCRENSDLMNKGLRRTISVVYFLIAFMKLWENSDLMNKGLRLYLERCQTPLTSSGENSDLMNKGLRPKSSAALLIMTLLPSWENSDLMNKGLRQLTGNTLWIRHISSRENSDLMNKGLRQVHPHGGCPREDNFVPERILTWWIKDCDL